jgi:hypothetical protein
MKANPVDSPPRRSRLWLWFVAAFVVQCAAWTTWFLIAAHHPVAEVPIEKAVGRRR